MTVTGLGNLAVKVGDLDAAVQFYEMAGATISDRGPWQGDEHRALYEDTMALPDDCFLHLAVFTDDVDSELEGHRVIWGPDEVKGSFGRRRIAFVEAPGGMRLEFMEQLVEPPTAASPPGAPPWR